MLITQANPTSDIAKTAQSSHHIEAPDVAEAQASIEAESKLGFRRVFRLYYKAALWSAMLSTALVMEGYDVGIVSHAP